MAREYSPGEREEWLSSLHRIPASATVAIENSNGCLLIVKANYKSYWSMPGGVIDEGESPKQAALREVAEEVGLALEPGSVQFIGATYRTSDILDTYQFVFGAQIDDDIAKTIVLQEEEIEEYAFVTKVQVKQNDRMYAPIVKRWASENIASYNEEIINLLAE